MKINIYFVIKFYEYVLVREDKEAKKDIENTMSKIPSKHADLVKNYKIIFQPKNTLAGDDRHIGVIDEKEKTITISAPWNYSRQYTLLHEIGHAVWKFILKDEDKKEWKKIVKSTRSKNKKDLNQNDEEIFCMSYAQHYAKNKLIKFDHEELQDFVSKI
jgi:hypothetical protein